VLKQEEQDQHEEPAEGDERCIEAMGFDKAEPRAARRRKHVLAPAYPNVRPISDRLNAKRAQILRRPDHAVSSTLAIRQIVVRPNKSCAGSAPYIQIELLGWLGRPAMNEKMIKCAAEAIGTFWLTFGGCGSAVIAAGFPQVGIGLLGVALAFGLTVLTMAY